jgi:hypothetical protein
VNEERNIVIEDGMKEEPPKKLTPEEAKLVEAYNVKKMNKKAKAKYTAKKDAQAEAEKIKEDLARAAEKAKEEQMRAAKLKKQEEAQAKRVAKDDKLTADAMARTRKRLGLG